MTTRFSGHQKGLIKATQFAPTPLRAEVAALGSLNQARIRIALQKTAILTELPK